MSITAVLNLYKRPYVLIDQLRAVQNQSIPPENIIIWKNSVEGIEMPEIPEELNHNIIIINSSKNWGVWGRFTIGLLVNSKYICVFDDDTIPGKHWFKNCVDTMQTHRGLLGTIGLRFLPGNRYIHEPKFGWYDNHNIYPEQVDIVGHAWFFEQAWLSHLWQFHPDYSKMFVSGEDIAFSYCLQKVGINTYVPPHPVDNQELWGSDPIKAVLYGNDQAGISVQPGAYDKFHDALAFFIEKGFKTMNNR